MSSHTTIIKQFIDSLVDISNTSEHTKRIEQWAEQQESGLLYDLAQALHEPIAGIPDWAARYARM